MGDDDHVDDAWGGVDYHVLSDDEIVDEIVREYRRLEILRALLDAAGLGEVKGHA